MTDKVVDASALAATVFLEPGYADTRARMDGCMLHAPALLRFEMANIAVKKIRNMLSDRDFILLQLDAGLAIPVAEHEVNQQQVVKLAEQLKLSAYDASYLWLAKRLNCELVTLDARLESAARTL